MAEASRVTPSAPSCSKDRQKEREREHLLDTVQQVPSRQSSHSHKVTIYSIIWMQLHVQEFRRQRRYRLPHWDENSMACHGCGEMLLNLPPFPSTAPSSSEGFPHPRNFLFWPVSPCALLQLQSILFLYFTFFSSLPPSPFCASLSCFGIWGPVCTCFNCSSPIPLYHILFFFFLNLPPVPFPFYFLHRYPILLRVRVIKSSPGRHASFILQSPFLSLRSGQSIN
ncbi:hypothetical protein BO99DRAFT_265283 [Aspergillus violaceofuscus CBS 115571]|uniref:Uncharacterized protein n=1 Tax=Aspergillus violaceofuscus (strain CBS 115571) TaxID=1450538 RepID=A0A2V5H0H0_ASPV1|nr:hypothetical protein BO99DRAFT_265283 [Aspergillus violaceofuscus CBS 115571]